MNVNTFDCKNVRMSVIVQSLSDSSHVYSEDVPVNEYYASGQTAFFSTSFEVAGASEAFEIIVKVVGGSIASGWATLRISLSIPPESILIIRRISGQMLPEAMPCVMWELLSDCLPI